MTVSFESCTSAFNRGDERSYYRRTLLRAGRVASLADAVDPEWRTASIARQDAALSAAAMAVHPTSPPF